VRLSPRALSVRREVDNEASQRRDVMQYALLIYRRPDDHDGLSDEQRKAVSGEY
jgi:hypothetical protein